MSALLELVRWVGRGLRGDGSAPLRLMELCTTCTELDVPLEQVTPGLVVLLRISERFGFSTASVGANLPRLMRYHGEVHTENERKLGDVEKLLKEIAPAGEPPLLIGDFASMLEIFGSLAAFPARVITVGLGGSTPKESSVTRRLMSAAPSEVSIGRMGRLGTVVGRYSREECVEDWRFLVPTGALLLVLLAARLGDPMANPASAAWLQLAVALKAWRDSLDVQEVLDLSSDLDLEQQVHQGLAIAASIFPELGRTVPLKRLNLSAVERRVAVPLAARKVVGYSLEGNL